MIVREIALIWNSSWCRKGLELNLFGNHVCDEYLFRLTKSGKKITSNYMKKLVIFVVEDELLAEKIEQGLSPPGLVALGVRQCAVKLSTLMRDGAFDRQKSVELVRDVLISCAEVESLPRELIATAFSEFDFSKPYWKQAWDVPQKSKPPAIHDVSVFTCVDAKRCNISIALRDQKGAAVFDLLNAKPSQRCWGDLLGSIKWVEGNIFILLSKNGEEVARGQLDAPTKHVTLN